MTEITQDRPSDRKFNTIGPDAPNYDRYGEVALGEGEVLLYDKNEVDAWIQSDMAIRLEEWTSSHG